jgi:6-phosphofructokinase 1
MAFIEEQVEILSKQPHKTRCAGPESAAVITIQASSIKWVPVQEMAHHADMVNRRGESAWWNYITQLAEELAGKPQFLGIPRSEWVTVVSR